MLRLAPMVDAVHRAGAAIWIQVGHGGLFAMEAWHEPYRVATRRARCSRRAAAARSCGPRSAGRPCTR